ncbi:ComF family protein [Tenacibaculum sp. SG-28]|uniref:ComF family protein n=1 Tax=Tenacibaculum sp. SG-28 TaxID=754426 RepID=UPI000CF543C0|nr:phosphoribosyltransferase family protein [Tenacibaculum sp. SG-28]PQJ21760.1 hypothetical protein BSU00_06725 [Tenacibaculum sp. SG-28]
MALFRDLLDLFFPRLCVNCYTPLLKQEVTLCVRCTHHLPVITYNEATKKMLHEIFYGIVPITSIYSLLYYRNKGIAKQLIHALKYKNQEEIGVFLADCMLLQIQKYVLFRQVDCITIVPLHKKKLRQRGYNQVYSFAKRISEKLELPLESGKLVRVSSSTTQTVKQRFERFSNKATKFLLEDPAFYENKHILLIDDVITTGGTLIDCCNALRTASNISISICCMAYTEKV